MDVLNLLNTLVALPSVNPFRCFPVGEVGSYVGLGTEREINLLIANLLEEYGFEVTLQTIHPATRVMENGLSIEVPARWNVLGVRYPRGQWNGKSILFFGHTDTVDIKSGWLSDPH